MNESAGSGPSMEQVADVIPQLYQLKLSGTDWTYSFNSVNRGRSGLTHKFDLAVSSTINSGELIVFLILRARNSNRMARITTFYAHAKDVEASRAIILTESELFPEEKMLSSSLGIEVLHINLEEKQESSNGPESKSGNAIRHEEHSMASVKNYSLRKRKKYRDRTQIIREVLNSTSSSEGATITRIISKCNLNYKTAKEVVGEMLKKELITLSNSIEDRNAYTITRLGSNILGKLYFYDSIGNKKDSA